MNTQDLKDNLRTIIGKADERLLRILYVTSREYLQGVMDEMDDSHQIYRLVYTSARSSKCSDQDIEEILEVSRKNNSAIGVTGILIHTKDRFLQVLEGRREVVTELYNKIEKDPRHGGSVMRFCEPVSTRYFQGWDMAAKKVNSNEVDFNTSISEQKKKMYKSMMDGDIHSYRDEGMRVLKTFLLFS